MVLSARKSYGKAKEKKKLKMYAHKEF